MTSNERAIAIVEFLDLVETRLKFGKIPKKIKKKFVFKDKKKVIFTGDGQANLCQKINNFIGETLLPKKGTSDSSSHPTIFSSISTDDLSEGEEKRKFIKEMEEKTGIKIYLNGETPSPISSVQTPQNKRLTRGTSRQVTKTTPNSNEIQTTQTNSTQTTFTPHSNTTQTNSTTYSHSTQSNTTQTNSTETTFIPHSNTTQTNSTTYSHSTPENIFMEPPSEEHVWKKDLIDEKLEGLLLKKMKKKISERKKGKIVQQLMDMELVKLTELVNKQKWFDFFVSL